ncbi:MAG: hypothetical protein ACO4AI_08855, partial [Prochlorothrix sp.]
PPPPTTLILAWVNPAEILIFRGVQLGVVLLCWNLLGRMAALGGSAGRHRGASGSPPKVRISVRQHQESGHYDPDV